MKKINNYLRSMSTIAAIGFFSMLAMLSPLMMTIANAQLTLTEGSFRNDTGDPDRYRLSDNDVIHIKDRKSAEFKR